MVQKCCQNFRAPENLTVSEWADKYRRLSPENSAESGRWKTSRTPYLKEIMNAFTDDRVERIVVVAGSQQGKTEAELNLLGYMIDQDPGPAMFCVPTLDLAKDFSKRRVAPMFRDTKVVGEKVGTAKARSSEGTMLKKTYPGGMLTMVGANAPAALASVPARYVFGDEIDRWTRDAGGEGDPWKLLEARTKTFYNRKMVEVSTPTIKGHSRIEDAFNLGTREKWSTKCPHCGEYHFINWESIRFEYEAAEKEGEKQYAVKKVSYACPSCGCESTENTMKRQPSKWIAESPDALKNGCRSFWISAFTSPWAKWDEIARHFLEAKDDPEKLVTVVNTELGALWEEKSDVADEDELAGRAEEYEAELPDGVLCLTCGVDTQDDRLEYEVVGYGFFEESWGIEKGIIHGYPDEDEVWEKLDGVIDKLWTFKSGKGLRISLTFVDMGGHHTKDVYKQCALRTSKRVFPIKGSNQLNAPFTAPAKKKNIQAPNGRPGELLSVWWFELGVSAGKEHIMTGLKITKKGGRYSHFPSNIGRGYDRLFYSGLLSEKKIYTDKGWKWVKLPGHERNEALDCRNYANAAFAVLHPNLNALKRRLARLEGTETAEEERETTKAAKAKKLRKQKNHKRELLEEI